MRNPLKNTEPLKKKKRISKQHTLLRSKNYYLYEDQGMWEIRQKRFRSQFLKGEEHPHDVMAVATSKKEIIRMYKEHLTN